MNSIVQKPWGEFQILNSGENYLIKKLIVKSGGILSLQSHNFRSEHWIIAEGKAEVTINSKVFNLKENDHIFVDKGATHRIVNSSKTNLVIIEIWYGNKLDEEDIKRYDDVYVRI